MHSRTTLCQNTGKPPLTPFKRAQNVFKMPSKTALYKTLFIRYLKRRKIQGTYFEI